MNANRLRIWTSCLALFCIPAAVGNAAVVGPTPVALLGTAAPAGGNYSTLGNPSLNASGQVAFPATLTGGSSTSGIFAGTPGPSGFTVQAAALQGTAAPAGGNYSSFLLIAPAINSAGQLAYTASLTGGSSTQGLFVGTPGPSGFTGQAVALQGTAAPAGGNYNNLSSPLLNASGQVQYTSSLTGGSSSLGFFVGTPGPSGFTGQTVGLAGTAAPAGGNYSVFGSTPILNASGQVAYFASLTGGSSTQGLFAGAPGSMQAAALVGTAAPTGGNYSSLGNPAINNAGQLAYSASLTGGSATAGLFVGALGPSGVTMQTAALQGDAAPAGGNYIAFTVPLLNASGQLAFRSTLTGGSSTAGIFAGAPGSFQTIVLGGAATPDGVGNFNSLGTSIAFNAAGQVAFTSSLTGTGVTTANDNGLYAGSAGDVVKIVREGDILDVDPGIGIDLRTVSAITFTAGSGGQDGKARGLNDDGLLVYRLTFTDSTSGIFTSQIVVPEPAGVILAAAAFCGAALLARRRNHRSRRTA
jgi:hypothetical protein